METRSFRLAIAWTAAWIALAILVAAITGPWMALYSSMGVELPWVTTYVVRAGDALRGPLGWFVLAPVLALGLLPLRMGTGQEPYRRWLLLGIGQAGLAAVLVWGALELPRLELRSGFTTNEDGDEVSLNPPPRDVGQMVAYAGVLLAPIVLSVAFVQVFAWLMLSRDVLLLRRADVSTEAMRAVVIATVPALGAAIGAYALVEDLRAGPSTGLVVEPSLAAAGTAVLVVYGAALWFRLRRPSE
jgi:hypothetical protein